MRWSRRSPEPTGSAQNAPGADGFSIQKGTDCPAGHTARHECGKAGYFSAVCRSRNVLAMRLAGIHIGMVQSAETAKYVTIEVNDVTAPFKVDTGAEVSAVPVNFPRPPKHLQNVRHVLRGPGN